MGNNKTLYLDEFLSLDAMPISMDVIDFDSLNTYGELCEGFYTKYNLDADNNNILSKCVSYNFRNDFTEFNLKDENQNTNHENNKSSDKMTDLYRPRQVRGVGSQREGYCSECNLWFKLKTSSYWYHMNFKHGINSQGTKYPEPITKKTNLGVKAICNKCNKWIHLGNRYNKKSIKYNWYKHWQKEHRNGDLNGS
ncbi:Meiotic expression up-regulated protein 26 [Astathelohania contejeani]|uniref:Meiotic expression up-regulated protein 26 n=1 Tax=Astathelohania contejeani TaxID=164912 RepID=A0ABQ7I0Z3_9MICR|nr:Meiotic expression up-regulated protein 26 [Thelohania contejeani]